MSDYTDLIDSLKNSAFLAFDDGTNDFSSPDEAVSAITDLQAKNRRLREALKVFANAADGRRRKDTMGSVCFEQDHLLKARAALRNTEASHE